jgi:hypothetical protein
VKTVVIWNLARRGKPSIWANPYSPFWYATKRIPYTEWKGDTQNFQEYLWDVRDLRSYDKAIDAQLNVSSLPKEVLFGPEAAYLAEAKTLIPKQRAYHYSVFVADEIEPTNGVRQFALAAS